MTVVPILSLSGAPGVTTMACLLASTWPATGPVAVIECDSSGGDLAARFGLSATLGWPSLSAAVRRTGTSTSLDPHLQLLPGGLPVLVGARAGSPVPADSSEARLVRAAFGSRASDGLAVIDLGRFPGVMDVAGSWLTTADYTIVMVRDDAAAALRVRERAEELVRRTEGRVGVVVVGGTGFDSRELAEFTGLAPLGDLPFDPVSAGVASGASGAGRRLERSRLLASTRRVAEFVDDRTGDVAMHDAASDGVVVPTSTHEPVRPSGRSPGSSLQTDDRRPGTLVGGAA
ncbi:MAG TPA: hypothetical protein VIJ60_00125 [Acidimicrobiales bacterium]